MSLKTKLILSASVLAAIGIGIGLELHRLHRRILEELVAIRQQGEQIDAVFSLSDNIPTPLISRRACKRACIFPLYHSLGISYCLNFGFYGEFYK